MKEALLTSVDPSPIPTVANSSQPEGVAATAPHPVTIAPGIVALVEAVGSALIRVTVTADANAPRKWSVELERYDSDGGPPATDGFGKSGQSSLHSAVSGQPYGYRFRLAKGEWTPLVEVRTAMPARGPGVPTNLSLRARDAFTTELVWDADATASAGQEIEVRSERGTRRAAIVDPTARTFQHAGRRPGSKFSYRIRSFNAAGSSAWSEEAEVTMPALSKAPALASKLGRCVTLPKEAPSTYAIGRDSLRGPPNELVNEPDSNDPLLRHLIGRANGCLRDLGSIHAQANISVVEGVDDDAVFPFLVVVAGAGSEGAQLIFLRFDGAKYEEAHRVGVCGDPPYSEPPTLYFGSWDFTGEPNNFRPPFGDCQMDVDLGSG